MSQKKIIHGDIKKSNILFQNQQLFLIDFGAANFQEDSYVDSGRLTGTTEYVPYEGWKDDDLSPSTDLWQVGILIFDFVKNF